MNRFPGRIFSLFVTVSLLTASAAACQPTATPGITLPPATPSLAFTRVVQDILADPNAFEGQPVSVVGYYRGWDLLGEAGSAPPVTRSDWVVRDETGAIYVLAGLAVEGEINLNPGSTQDTTRVVRVTGVVRVTDAGQPYIEPTRIEVIK